MGSLSEVFIDNLEIINKKFSGKRAVLKMLEAIKFDFGIEAAAVRIYDNGGYPFFSLSGYTEPFYEIVQKHCLCIRGESLTDDGNKPVFDCMCGDIIAGMTDPSLPCFTKKGSFWTNNIQETLCHIDKNNRYERMSNIYSIFGYKSAAIIPLICGEELIGLLHLNDKRAGIFSQEKIETLESICGYFALFSLIQRINETAAENERLYSVICQGSSTFHDINQPLQILMGNCELISSGIIDKTIETILDSTRRIAEILQKLHILLKSGKNKYQFQPKNKTNMTEYYVNPEYLSDNRNKAGKV